MGNQRYRKDGGFWEVREFCQSLPCETDFDPG